MEHVAKDLTSGHRLLAQLDQATPYQNENPTVTCDSSRPFFKTAQWTADGTTVVGTTSHNRIETFIIPPDLLEDRPEPCVLEPYSTTACPEPVDALALYPGFNLQDPATALGIFAVNEHPILLTSVLTADRVASYPLINATTEAYIKPHSIVFSPDGTRFFCGSESLISCFDLSRPGQEPFASSRTGPKQSKGNLVNPATCMRGIVSALAIDPQYNIMAAATLTRHIGLYDAGGEGQCVGVFSVQGTAADEAVSGRGITQVLWSPCGRYLYISERKSNGVMFYDIRKTGQLLGWIEGRKAGTNQRLHIDLGATQQSADHNIWAGGMDGIVRSWIKPYMNEGAVAPTFEHRVHDDVVSNAVVHSSGSVLATTSGQRAFDSKYALDEAQSLIDPRLSCTSEQTYRPDVIIEQTAHFNGLCRSGDAMSVDLAITKRPGYLVSMTFRSILGATERQLSR